MSVSGKLLGGHCVLIMGYNGSKKLFKIKNSYGVGWGNRGYAYLSLYDLQKLLNDGGEACVGIESKIKPKR
jgi:C1A family cysteine protease